MEGKGQMGSSSSSSSSSFTADLFGTKEPQPSPSTGIFASIFPPPSKVVGRGRSTSDTKQGSPTRRTEAVSCNIPNKQRSSMFPEERAEPCHLSSSLYYGGQDVYSQSQRNQTSGSYPINRKDRPGEGDANGNNSQDASRGNWWQGSLYY